MIKWEHDDWVTVQPDEEKIACKDCLFREPDREAGNGITIKGCTLGTCQIFRVANRLKFCLETSLALTTLAKTKKTRMMIDAWSHCWRHCWVRVRVP